MLNFLEIHAGAPGNQPVVRGPYRSAMGREESLKASGTRLWHR